MRGSGLPVLAIDIEKITANARGVVGACARFGIDVWGVTKGVSSAPEVARALLAGGCRGICDSRLMNIASLREHGVDAPMHLIRIAMPSEARDAVELADLSYQSEVSTIRLLDDIAASIGRTHDVIIMIDMGDLREGIWPEEIPEVARALRTLSGGVRIVGVGANFGCASGVLPTPEKLRELAAHRDALGAALGAVLPIVSVGGTVCLKVIESGECPREVNVVRLGEAMLLGTDTGWGGIVRYAHQDALVLTVEVIERKVKPSLPVGVIGANAFGDVPTFEDRGMRSRALVALGGQDVDVDRLVPLDPGVEIVTASSDHTILDVTEHEARIGRALAPGDRLSFRPGYKAMLDLTTSKYVRVSFEKDRWV